MARGLLWLNWCSERVVTNVMREVSSDSLAAEEPVAKVFVVWFEPVMLHECGCVDVVNM